MPPAAVGALLCIRSATVPCRRTSITDPAVNRRRWKDYSGDSAAISLCEQLACRTRDCIRLHKADTMLHQQLCEGQ